MGILAGLLAGFIVSADANTNGQESPPADGASVFEQFKEFIANPPPIEDIVFSYQGPPVSRLDPATKQIIKQPAPIQHIRAQWGPEHGLVVTSPMPESLIPEPLTDAFELKEGTQLVVRSKDEFWNFFSPNRVAYWKGVPAYPYERGNSVLGAYLQRTSPLFAFLNMGPHFMGPQSVRWSGNRFSYQAKVIQGEFLIEGELFPGSNGFPEKMTFRIRSATADGRYLVRYHYGTNAVLPRFIPERVHSIVYHGAAEYPDKDIRIASLKFGTPASPPPEHAVATWIKQRPFSELIYTNQTLYAVEPGGELRLVPRQAPTWKPPYVLAHANRYYYVSCGLVSAGFLVLAWRMREQTKPNSQMKGIPCKEML